MQNNLCGTCDRATSTNGPQLKCSNCHNVFHKSVNCSFLDNKTRTDITNRNVDWLCSSCVPDIFPFSNIDTNELIEIFSVFFQDNIPKPGKKPNATIAFEELIKTSHLCIAKIAANSITWAVAT